MSEEIMAMARPTAEAGEGAMESQSNKVGALRYADVCAQCAPQVSRSAAEASSRAQQDPDYPLFHVAPPVGRLNDPNGLIEVDGTYHAFFQYTPEHPRKLVYWGHATSRDLTRWDYHAPAILPDTHQDANGAYSGTAIEVGDHVELWYTGNYKDSETGEREATKLFPHDWLPSLGRGLLRLCHRGRLASSYLHAAC